MVLTATPQPEAAGADRAKFALYDTLYAQQMASSK